MRGYPGKVLFAIWKLWHTAPVCLNFYGQCGRMDNTLQKLFDKTAEGYHGFTVGCGDLSGEGPPAGR